MKKELEEIREHERFLAKNIPMKKKSDERRKHERFLARNEYTLILDGKQYIGVIGDISMGGVFLKKTSPQLTECDSRRECDILINLDDNIIFIPCIVSIIYGKNSDHEPRAGIQFDLPIKEKAMAVIREYIDLKYEATA